MDKPNCYRCEYRGSIPGDAHSMCHHPKVSQDDNPFGALFDLFSGKNDKAMVELGITGDTYGIRSGWFMWPANYDPVWLISCNGFKEKQ